MQKHSDPSGFLTNSTGAPHSEEDSYIAPAPNNSSNYFLISNYFWGLCQYMDFHTGLAPSPRGILCMSPSLQLGGAHVGNVLGNTSQYSHNTVCNDVLDFSSTLCKCGITLLEALYPHIKYLIKIVWGSWMLLIAYHM